MKPECRISFLILIIYFETFVARFVLVVQAGDKIKLGLCMLTGYTRLEVLVRNVPHLLMCF